MAVMGFGITDLVIASGVIILLAGASTIALATPTIYLLAGIAMKDRP